MMQPYTAVDLIRVMGQEMNGRHADAAHQRQFEGEQRGEVGGQPVHRSQLRWSPVSALRSVLGRPGA